TPDLLPSDITGVSVFHQDRNEFEFNPGPVFANIVLGDEINRASPKTQSALLECMEERQVSVDGRTRALESPFMVVATQNPSATQRSSPQPEAQRVRFIPRVSVGYPAPQVQFDMIGSHSSGFPLESLEPATETAQIRSLIDQV